MKRRTPVTKLAPAAAETRMHLHDRHRQIVSALHDGKVTSVEYLADQLNVSPATIRRDLGFLDTEQVLRRVRGGAVPIDQIIHDRSKPRDLVGQHSFVESEVQHRELKLAIARIAAEMCAQNKPIIIDGGTTTFMMAKLMRNEPYQVLTTSIPILTTLLKKNRIRVMTPGGEVFREQNIILNPYEDGILQNYAAETIFMGAQAITAAGLMQSDPLLVQSERRLIERAKRIVVLVDSSKFEAAAPLSVCALSKIDTLITDDQVSDAAEEMLAKTHVKLIRAPTG